MKLAEKLLLDKFHVGGSPIENAHRTGKAVQGHPRHVIAQFYSRVTRMDILRTARAKLSATNIRIVDDLTQEDLREKNRVRPFMDELYKRQQRPSFRNGRLYADGKEVALDVINAFLKPGVHTNDFRPIYGRRDSKLGHASLATVFRLSRLTFQPILESPVARYQPITTAVIRDACLNTRWNHGAYVYHRKKIQCGCLEIVARSGSCRDSVRGSVGAMNAELSRPDLLATVQSGRKLA